jgi:hypothetical protein
MRELRRVRVDAATSDDVQSLYDYVCYCSMRSMHVTWRLMVSEVNAVTVCVKNKATRDAATNERS